mmetsp:Transcript_5059/g.12865  ORF Transcript_5059/g.12865 Transcript_5059/m.12865 type:complete len:212 (-) Transcript_5059:52-687(-)
MASSSARSFISSKPNLRCWLRRRCADCESMSKPAIFAMSLSSRSSLAAAAAATASASSSESSRRFFAFHGSPPLCFFFFGSGFLLNAFILFSVASLSKVMTSTLSSSESSSMPSASALVRFHSLCACSRSRVCTSRSSRRATARRRAASDTAASTVGNAGSDAPSRFSVRSSVRYRCRSPGVTRSTEAPSALARPVRPHLCTYVSADSGTW